MNEAPDYISPLIGYRAWKIQDGLLISPASQRKLDLMVLKVKEFVLSAE